MKKDLDLIDVIKEATKIALSEAGLDKPYLIREEANSVYGRHTVQNWINHGIVHEHKDGENSSTVRISREELLRASLKSNRAHLTLEENENKQ